MKGRCAMVHGGRLRAFEIQIDHDGILTASYHYGLTGFVGASVDLLMRHVRWNVDEATRSQLRS